MSLPPADTRWPAEALREEIRFDGRRMRCYAQRWPHLNAMLAQAVRRRPAASAIVDGNLIWSWRGVDTASRRLAGGLQRAGVQRGDRVLMLMGNRAEFILALHAVLRLGAVAVPVSIREAAPGVAYIVNQCQARAVLADAELCALPPAALDNGEPLLRVVAAGDGATPAGWQ
ncbi:MAG: long-chain fatty acid--CoA ligase, partial [Betaproteobacteria bacterium]|nr:long-chain fatty acid--CoA ligase [Betaproteobacteria bacterium]